MIAAGALAFVLMLSQTFGLLHGIVHGPVIAALHAAHGRQVPAAPGVLAQSGDAGGHFPGLLFRGHGRHGGDSDCRLYDQSSHFDTLASVPMLSLPLVLLPFVVPLLPGLALARWHALFQARGPPPVR